MIEDSKCLLGGVYYGKDIDLVGLDMVDDPVGAFEDLPDLFELELRDWPSRKRKLSNLL